MLCLFSFNAQSQEKIKTIDLAQKVLNKGLSETDLGTYQGSLLLQGMTELALVNHDKEMLAQIISLYQKFGTNEIQGKGSFISYKAGGNGAAFLKYQQKTNVLNAQVANGANQMFNGATERW